MSDIVERIRRAEKITADWGERCPDHDPDCACCQIWAMHDRIEELEKALEPFAAEAGCYDPDTGDGDDTVWAVPAYFKIRDLRSARDALRPTTAEESKG